jgi:hypothetical protein
LPAQRRRNAHAEGYPDDERPRERGQKAPPICVFEPAAFGRVKRRLEITSINFPRVNFPRVNVAWVQAPEANRSRHPSAIGPSAVGELGRGRAELRTHGVFLSR